MVGQDILWDLSNESDGAFANSLVNIYLGVNDVLNDVTFSNASIATTTSGVTGTFTQGLVWSGCDSDTDMFVDGFNTASVLSTETGTAVWDTTGGWPGTLAFTATSSSFGQTVFNGTYYMTELTDEAMVFDNHSLWSTLDGMVTVNTDWYEWTDPVTPNLYYQMDLRPVSGNLFTYKYYLRQGVRFSAWPDAVNTLATPANADTLLVNQAGSAFGVQVAGNTTGTDWRTIFLPFAYVGLGSDSNRQLLLQESIQWLSP
jgi:hypothetical protein